MNTSTCKGCGARILWVRTTAGRMMPCEQRAVQYWERPDGRHKIVTRSGRVVSCEFSGDGPPNGLGHSPHFAVCPKAGQFRRQAAPADEPEQLKIDI